jgi:hypothetical protein
VENGVFDTKKATIKLIWPRRLGVRRVSLEEAESVGALRMKVLS